MSSRLRVRLLAFISILSLAFALASCAGGPPEPTVGSPEWHWQAAKTTWDIGDLNKTSDNLEPLVKADNQMAALAQPWQLILTAGMATGYMDVADAFEQGARANKSAPLAFNAVKDRYHNLASKEAAEFYQTYMEFKKTDQQGDIRLGFSFPKGNSMIVTELTRAAEGMKVSDAELTGAVKRALQRAVLLTTCLAVGAENDPAKAQLVFEDTEPAVSLNTFMLAMAKKLNEIANYYSPNKISNSERMKLFNDLALEAAKSLPESDETKDLIKKIESELKAAGKK